MARAEVSRPARSVRRTALSRPPASCTKASSNALRLKVEKAVNRCAANESEGTVLAIFAALLAVLAAIAPASAQTKSEIVPDTWQGDALRPKPDLHGLDKLRFVTDSDYPPFHYFDEEG